MSNSINKIDTNENNIKIGSSVILYKKDYYSLNGIIKTFNYFDSFMSRYDNRFIETGGEFDESQFNDGFNT